jgi:hypothetical protein
MDGSGRIKEQQQTQWSEAACIQPAFTGGRRTIRLYPACNYRQRPAIAPDAGHR